MLELAGVLIAAVIVGLGFSANSEGDIDWQIVLFVLLLIVVVLAFAGAGMVAK